MNIAEMKIVLLKGQVFFKLIQIKLCICISQDCTQQGLPFTIICFVLLSSTWKIISATQPPPPTPTPSSMAQPTLSTVRLHAGCLPGGGGALECGCPQCRAELQTSSHGHLCSQYLSTLCPVISFN